MLERLGLERTGVTEPSEEIIGLNKETGELRDAPRAGELHRRMQELGSIAKQELREWLAEQDPELTPSYFNFVLGHGMTSNRTWWQEG